MTFGRGELTLYTQMTDAELIERTARARDAAHNAPLNTFHLDADGHKWIDAWIERTNDWILLANECERRGLNKKESPQCNTPSQ